MKLKQRLRWVRIYLRESELKFSEQKLKAFIWNCEEIIYWQNRRKKKK